MSDLKITINHLKNYLGTGLKLYVDQFGEGQEELIGIINDEVQTNVDSTDIDLVRPVMYRLTDLDKFIPELGFVPAEKLIEDGWSQHQIALICQGAYTHASFEVMQRLFQWHFWSFGEEFFEQGLVIDNLKHTQNENTSKRMGSDD